MMPGVCFWFYMMFSPCAQRSVPKCPLWKIRVLTVAASQALHKDRLQAFHPQLNPLVHEVGRRVLNSAMTQTCHDVYIHWLWSHGHTEIQRGDKQRIDGGHWEHMWNEPLAQFSGYLGGLLPRKYEGFVSMAGS